VPKRLFGRYYRSQLGTYFLPAAVVLLETELQLTVSFEIDEGSFAFDWMECIVEHMRLDVPLPLAAFASGGPRNLVLVLLTLLEFATGGRSHLSLIGVYSEPVHAYYRVHLSFWVS
jgi:hypothetical protein